MTTTHCSLKSKTSQVTYLIQEVPELSTTHSPLTIPENLFEQYDWEQELVRQAAQVYYFGQSGWACEHGWPLTFSVWSDHKLLTQRIVFILDGQNPPQFDII